jgi:hypothetical protein
MPVKNSGGEDCKTFLIASQFVPQIMTTNERQRTLVSILSA